MKSLKENPYYRLMRFDKPIGTWLLLWQTLCGVWIASQGFPKISILLIFIAGVIVMRAAGGVINDICDRKYDGFVERTRTRPLATGELSTRQAFVCFAILCWIALALVLMLNWKVWVMAAIGLVLTMLYPLMKRITHWPQAWLGIVWSWSIPMAFMAVRGSTPDTAWILYAAVVSWTIAYDTMYAMSDLEDDVKIGVKSTAILFGRNAPLIIAYFQVFTIVMLIILGAATGRGVVYFIAVFIVMLGFAYQQTRIRAFDRQDCLKMFLGSRWLVLVLFIGIALSYVI